LGRRWRWKWRIGGGFGRIEPSESRRFLREGGFFDEGYF
jgi:hypothetical protein